MKQGYKIKARSPKSQIWRSSNNFTFFHQGQQEVGGFPTLLPTQGSGADCEEHPMHSLFTSPLLWFLICNSIAALEALWFMYSTQRLWEGMFKAFNHRITPPPDVICQGLMNCWLCFSGGASLMYYRWTAGPGLLSVCIAYVESSLKSL